MLATAQPLTVARVADDRRFDAEVDRAPGYVVDNLCCAPVLSALGETLGAVQLANKVSERWRPGRHDVQAEPRPFDAADERALALMCAILGPALERQLLSNERFYTR